jgi:hypothetical protein
MRDFPVRPHLAIALGDPAGIGSEVVLKALATPLPNRQPRPAPPSLRTDRPSAQPASIRASTYFRCAARGVFARTD